MLDGAMVDHKIFVYNAARDNNLAALKVSVRQSLYNLSHSFSLFVESLRSLIQWMNQLFSFDSVAKCKCIV